jgi:hypothetical protein
MQSKITKIIERYKNNISLFDNKIKKLNEKKRVARAAGNTEELQDLLNEGQVVIAQRQCYTQAISDLKILRMEMEDA